MRCIQHVYSIEITINLDLAVLCCCFCSQINLYWLCFGLHPWRANGLSVISMTFRETKAESSMHTLSYFWLFALRPLRCERKFYDFFIVFGHFLQIVCFCNNNIKESILARISSEKCQWQNTFTYDSNYTKSIVIFLYINSLYYILLTEIYIKTVTSANT